MISEIKILSKDPTIFGPTEWDQKCLILTEPVIRKTFRTAGVLVLKPNLQEILLGAHTLATSKAILGDLLPELESQTSRPK